MIFQAVRARYLSLSQPQQVPPLEAARVATGVVGDAFRPTEDAEQLLNRMDGAPLASSPQPDVSFGPFTIPQPPPTTGDEVNECKFPSRIISCGLRY